MPTTKTTRDTALNVRMGDLVEIIDTDAIVVGKKLPTTFAVEGKELKTKNIIVSTPDGDITVRRDAAVDITREVPTVEERAARYEEQLRRRLESFIGGEAKAIEAFNEYAAKNGFVYAVEWGHPSNVIEARILEGYAKNILGAVDREENPLTLVEACAEARRIATKRVMQMSARAGSRSTNQWSNLCEDEERAAHVKVAEEDGFGWLQGYDRYLEKILRGEDQ